MTPTPDDTAVDGGELLDDGQEEVFSRTAVERGLVKDPKALSQGEDLADDRRVDPSKSCRAARSMAWSASSQQP